MLLTSPLVVTLGLSLSIPLSLVGQFILNSQTASPAYWIGALAVFVSFIFVSHETREANITSRLGDLPVASSEREGGGDSSSGTSMHYD